MPLGEISPEPAESVGVDSQRAGGEDMQAAVAPEGDEAVEVDDEEHAEELERVEGDDEPALAPEAVDPASIQAEAVVLLTPKDVKSVKYGYGPNGESVQETLHSADLTDRVVMQKTLLCGRAVIDAKTACERMQSSRRSGRKALPQPTWSKVMAAGADGSGVVRYAERKLYMKKIPQEGSDRIEYHNELMKLCGISLRDVVEAMKSQKKKDAEKQANRVRQQGVKRERDGEVRNTNDGAPQTE